MATREPAPTRGADESAGRFLRRVHGYLAEPHRRRLGKKSERDMLAAIQEMESDR